MNLEDIRALLAVVEHGSVKRAARTLRVSRGALGRTLDRLEADLEVQLLVRGSRGITLTPAGQALADDAPELLRAAARVTERVRTSAELARGTLRFLVPAGLPVAPRARALQALARQHPELDVVVVEDEDPVGRRDEAFDLLLHFGPPVSEPTWYSQVLTRFEMRLQASVGFIRKNGLPSSAASVSELLYFALPGEVETTLPVRRRGALSVTPRICSGNLSLLYALAEAGAGVLYGPLVPPALGGSARLRPIVDEVAATLTLRALSPRSSRVDPRLRALLNNARAFIRAQV